MSETPSDFRGKGCLNHGCLINPIPNGRLGTNAICRCVYDKPHVAEQKIRSLEAKLKAKAEELDLMRILHSSECDRNAWLKVEFTAAQKNEDRYRWLLDNGNITVREIFGYDSPHLNSGLEIAIDAAIDAAKGNDD